VLGDFAVEGVYLIRVVGRERHGGVGATVWAKCVVTVRGPLNRDDALVQRGALRSEQATGPSCDGNSECRWGGSKGRARDRGLSSRLRPRYARIAAVELGQ
jgi:hypothetical protein